MSIRYQAYLDSHEKYKSGIRAWILYLFPLQLILLITWRFFILVLTKLDIYLALVRYYKIRAFSKTHNGLRDRFLIHYLKTSSHLLSVCISQNRENNRKINVENRIDDSIKNLHVAKSVRPKPNHEMSIYFAQQIFIIKRKKSSCQIT